MSTANESPKCAPLPSHLRTQVLCEVTPAYSSCTYIVLASGADEALIVDPGNPMPDGVVELLESHQVRRVPYLFVTHEHFDHIAGSEALRKRFGNRLICSQACAEAIGDPRCNMSFYKDGKGITCAQADWICERDGWELRWSAGPIWMMSTPGHSPGGISVAVGGHLFTGDTLMGNRRTPTHLPGGDAAALRHSLSLLFFQFDSKTLVYPGHGTHFALGEVDLRKVLSS